MKRWNALMLALALLVPVGLVGQERARSIRVAALASTSVNHLGGRTGWAWGLNSEWIGAEVGLAWNRPFEPTLTLGYTTVGIACPDVVGFVCDRDGPFAAVGFSLRLYGRDRLELYATASGGAMRRHQVWDGMFLAKGGLRFPLRRWIAPKVELGMEHFPVVETNPALTAGIELLLPTGS